MPKKFGLTDNEIKIVEDQIIQRTKNAVINGDCVSFVQTMYDRMSFDLEDWLPDALKKENREKWGIPEEYKRKLTGLYYDFQRMPLEQKIEYLEDDCNWVPNRGKYIVGDLDDYHLFQEKLEGNLLYNALTLLDEIMEKEQSQQK